MTVTTAVVVLPRRVAVWASDRAVARTSLTGIELACALCAAVWFSAGTPLSALGGGAALGGGYLARRVGGQLTVGAFEGWLASTCGLAGELAVYAGLAAGAAPGQQRVWALATAAAVLLGMRKVARLCRPAPGRPQPSPGDERTGRDRTLAVLAGRLPGLPAGERAVVITVTAAVYGTRMSLLVLTWWGAVALAWAVAGPRPQSGSARPAGSPPPAPRPADIVAARDDGPIARFAGSLVRGQLVPLPPAVAGLTATILLATLGLHDLAGPVLLTPVAAMLLAAPGSAHPHHGPLDWLTPLVIQAGQYAYLAALGFAKGVPGPLVFALTGLVGLRQLDAAYRARQPLPAGDPRGGIGWEGRMLAAGVGAMLGVATFSYLALTVYLLWLLGSGSLASWLAGRAQPRGGRRPRLGS
ncbi:MAG: hypothetical protein QOG05_1278 [Streptosporangiaceae bacterium]|nr:hypothetical protein [Streptosporangiaceae bacterium]